MRNLIISAIATGIVVALWFVTGYALDVEWYKVGIVSITFQIMLREPPIK